MISALTDSEYPVATPTDNGSTPPSTDAELVQRLQQRDKTALNDVVERHGGMMYRVALGLMRTEDGAREVVQDALISVWKKGASYRGQAQFGTWLYRVTANAALMQLRKQRQTRRVLSFDDLAMAERFFEDMVNDRPDTAMLRSELGERVQQAIDGLPEPYRSAVILSDVEGLSLAEIAALTQESVGAIKSRLHRARLILRKKLSRYLDDPAPAVETPGFFGGLCEA